MTSKQIKKTTGIYGECAKTKGERHSKTCLTLTQAQARPLCGCSPHSRQSLNAPGRVVSQASGGLATCEILHDDLRDHKRACGDVSVLFAAGLSTSTAAYPETKTHRVRNDSRGCFPICLDGDSETAQMFVKFLTRRIAQESATTPVDESSMTDRGRQRDPLRV